jgi:hypothetical protein
VKKHIIVLRSKTYILLLLLGLGLAAVGCSGPQRAIGKRNDFSDGSGKISLLVGIAAGGLVENMEMTGIAGVADVDAITGATQTLFNAGIHSERDIKGHKFETGLDYLSFDQSIKYQLPSLTVTGTRAVQFQQLRLPLTYNFHFSKDNRNYPGLILKAGLSVGYTFSKEITDSGNPPAYRFNDWDYGPLLGVSVYPRQFQGRFRTGIYLDLYRGSRIYDDIYHRAEGMGGQSFMKFGIILQPAN